MRGSLTHIVLMPGQTRTVLIAGPALDVYGVGYETDFEYGMGWDLSSRSMLPANADRTPLRIAVANSQRSLLKSERHV